MKRLSVVLVLILVIFTLGCAKKTQPTKLPENSLYIYNWEDYISEDVVKNFESYYEKKYGKKINVVYTTFDTNETMITKVTKDSASVDLICPSEYAIEKLSKMNFLENISDLRTKYGADNLSNIDTSVYNKIKENFGEEFTKHMVPYMWGTLGVLYNKQVIKNIEELGWGVLWNKGNNPELYNKILLKDSIRDTYAAALFYIKEQGKLPQKYNNLSIQQLINTVEHDLIKLVEKELVAQRKVISGYEVDFGKDDLINKFAYADLAWSGDAIWAISEAPKGQLDYYVPKSGSNVWFDGWVIPKSAQHKKLALEFLDYICRPENAIKNSLHIGYTSAVKKDLIQNNEDAVNSIKEADIDPDEFFSSNIRYPVIDDSLGIMRDFGKKNTSVVQMWERVKAGKETSFQLLYISLGLIGVLALIVGVIFLVQKLNNQKRRNVIK